MKKIILAILIVLLVASVSWSQQKVITRPVTLVCAYSAGGGTDQVNRGLAEGMKEPLGVQVNVVNMTGGGGAFLESPKPVFLYRQMEPTTQRQRTGSGSGPEARRAFSSFQWIQNTRLLRIL